MSAAEGAWKMTKCTSYIVCSWSQCSGSLSCRGTLCKHVTSILLNINGHWC